METEIKQRFFSYKDASIYLSLSKKSIKRLLDDGYIRGFKVKENGRVLIYPETLTEENILAKKPKFFKTNNFQNR
jgi:hypothetical protein